MVDLGLRLIDYLVAFSEQREKNATAFFDRYVQPTYTAAEVVYRDYVAIFSGGRNILSRSGTLEELIAYLTTARETQRPIRTQLRAVLDQRLFASLGDHASEFEEGIFGLLCGAVQFTETGRYTSFPFALADIGREGQNPHTLLDFIRDVGEMAERMDSLTPEQLEKLQNAAGSKAAADAQIERIRRWQTRAIPSLDAQIEGLHTNWQRIANGYVVYQKRTLPRSVLPKRN